MPKNRASVLSLEMNSSVLLTDVSGESVTVPAGAAGTIKNCQIKNFPIRSAGGGQIGGVGDTSLTFTSTTFDREVSMNTLDADLVNGDYYVNYLTGELRGKKKDTGTGLTVAYKIAVLNIKSIT